jgi:hypothetical protein
MSDLNRKINSDDWEAMYPDHRISGILQLVLFEQPLSVRRTKNQSSVESGLYEVCFSSTTVVTSAWVVSQLNDTIVGQGRF